MSLLLDHGHTTAPGYPVGMLQDEALIVIERQDRESATHALLANAASAATKSKKGVGVFTGMIDRLTGGGNG